jgi:hypothetical protein
MLWLAVIAMAASSAFAQGGSASSLSGTVLDASGAVMPGVDVVARNNATAAVTSAVTDGEGRFTIPALEPGKYTVTVSLSGFKTVILPDVQIVTATPASVKITLELGNIEESITVTGATAIVQTETATVSTTLTTTQMTKLPLPTRNSMDFLASLPGVDQAGSIRDATVMGLRQSATNITIDGINTQDNYLKSSDGFFSRISPRLDAIEEVTVSTANPGAESAGQGAVQVRFTTRSGTNQYQGSSYWYLRRPEWNTNYWFNKRDGLPKDEVKVDTYGARVGGPISRDRLFFFFNYEEVRQPASMSRNKTILTTQAQQGIFQYNSATGVQSVNLLDIAAKNGQTATADPTVAALLAAIRNSTNAGGSITQLTDPNLQRFSFINTSENIRRFPTTRVDANLTTNHRVGVSYYAQQYDTTPDLLNSYDSAFPGFANQGSQYSMRWSVMGNWRAVLGRNMVNEFRTGATGGPVSFQKGVTADQFADQNGFGLNISAADISNAYVGRNPNERDAPTYVVENTLNWLKGRHSVTMGGTFTQIDFDYTTGNIVPTISFGVDQSDPATALFTTANFPGAASSDLANARDLYAVLTGRVTGINGAAVLDGDTGKYVYMGRAQRLAHMREFGAFVQDSWRVRPGLTVNGGIRYELQLPFVPLNDYYSMVGTPDNFWGVSGPDNLFKPGATGGTPTEFVQYQRGTRAYNTEWNNFAPSGGIAWTPARREGVLGALMGRDGDFVLRGGYSLSYNREGMATFDNIFSYNPGGSIDATRSMTLGNLVPAGSSLPVLLRNGNLSAPSFQEFPSYPSRGVVTDSANMFDPDTRLPYTHSWTAGIQRAITKDMAFEVRYVGTRGRNGWADGGRNYNEVNVIENGFLDEFKTAQANLYANIAAGRGNNFRYYGEGTGTSPLPIYLAYFAGLASNQAGDPSKYASVSNFANTTYVNHLARRNPLPYSAANLLGGTTSSSATTRNNAIAAGLPANFFVANPGLLGGIWLTTNDQLSSNYDALQLEVRRRMSKGLLITGSYTFADATLSSFYTLRQPAEQVRSSGSQGTLRHAFKFNWVYELPIGRGRKFGTDVNPWVDRLIGGWDVSGAGRIQSGRVLNFGNVRLVGMNQDELQDMFKIYRVQDAAGKTRVYTLPQEVIDNTLRAFSVSATSATGYSSLGVPEGRYLAPANGPDCIQAISGDCAPRQVFVTGPKFVRFDMSLAKRFPIHGRAYATFTAEALNVFDNINFTPVAYAGSTAGSYEVTGAYRDTNNTQDPGGRVVQLSFRFSF